MGDGAEKVAAPAATGEVVYVVQVRQEFDVIQGYATPVTAGAEEKPLTAKQFAWVDVATVSVPPRTHRKTVLKKALAETSQAIVGLEVGQEMSARLLGPDAAEETSLLLRPRDPELVIGGEE